MNLKKTMLFFCFALASSVTLRTLMIFFTTEASSGFFKKEYAVFSYGMLAIIIAAILLCAVFSFKCIRPKAPKFFNKVNVAICTVLGLCIGAEALLLDFSASAVMWQNLLQTLFGVIAGAVFIWLGLYFADIMPSPGIFLILPALFYIFRIIVVFVTYSGVSTIADNSFELASLCATLICMIQFAKIHNGVSTEKVEKRILPTALAAGMIIFTQIIPVIIAMLSGNGSLVHSNILFAPTCIVMGVFILFNSSFIQAAPEYSKKTTYTPRHGGSGFSVQELILNDNDDEE